MAVAAVVAAFSSAQTAGAEYHESDDCWTFGGMDQLNPGFGPGLCCRPQPCGLKSCWHPPEFTYHFCCREPACRPSVVTDIQGALELAVAALPNTNASNMAFRAAPEAFRAILRRGLHGLRLTMTQGAQDCPCAVAYAVAVLLDPTSSKFAGHLLTPAWFALGLTWSEIVDQGWGPLFGWLAQNNGSSGRHSSVDLAQRPLSTAVEEEQERARAVANDYGEGDGAFSAFTARMRTAGLWGRIWRQVSADLEARRRGHKCVAAADGDAHGRWGACTPWSYTADADFTSPAPGVGARGSSTPVAVCVLGAPRNVLPTYNHIRENVLKTLGADAFLYVPFSRRLTRTLEAELTKIGPVVTAIVVPDVDREGMQARIVNDLSDPQLAKLYATVPGPWRAPLFDQMGSSMWGYFAQHVCKRMVEAYEEQRQLLYDWVVFARADLYWTHRHPPIGTMTPGFVYVPFGQDNSRYAHGPEPGLNDRHAVVSRSLMQGYFGRWDDLRSGDAYRYLEKIAQGEHPINTEQYLLLHLRYHKVPVRRFPPIAFVTQCAEGPQCQHLYKGTDLHKREWLSSAKYWSELIEVRRTIHDGDVKADKPMSGWIWVPLRPHAPLAPAVNKPWELWGVDLACCSTRSGPVSCYRWFFFRRCQSLA